MAYPWLLPETTATPLEAQLRKSPVPKRSMWLCTIFLSTKVVKWDALRALSIYYIEIQTYTFVYKYIYMHMDPLRFVSLKDFVLLLSSNEVSRSVFTKRARMVPSSILKCRGHLKINKPLPACLRKFGYTSVCCSYDCDSFFTGYLESTCASKEATTARCNQRTWK